MVAKTPKPCGCSPGCEATTGRAFAPGHDARMISRLAPMVAADALDLEQAALTVVQAGGSRALVAKLVTRMHRFPVRWERVTATTLLTPGNALGLQYFGSRENAGLPPWIMVRPYYVSNDIVERPEMEWVDGGTGDREPAFWSPTDAVAWQANEQKLVRSPWRVRGARPDWPDPEIQLAEWDWLDK